MNDVATTEAEDTPRGAKGEYELAQMIRDRGRRTSSGPAAKTPRQKAGHMTAADQTIPNVKKPLAERGRPHMMVLAW
jgi:hypothetical protein